MRRCLLVVALALCAAADARAQQVALDLSATAPAPLTVHEWGVWRIRAGQIDHLADLARETPSFVHRAPQGPPPVTPRTADLEIALKPVVFLYADAPLDVDVTVEMPGGEPWLYYPSAIAGITEAPQARTVRWNLHVLPTTSTEPAHLPSVPPTHWWNALRAVGASTAMARDTHEAERFLFYDGPATFVPQWRVSGQSIQPIARVVAGARTAWLIDAARAVRVSAGRNHRVVSEPLSDVTAVRTELTAALHSAGLSAAESDSLLRTWQGDLFQSTARRAIWLLPRAAYDTMLPLQVLPRPRELVRVGVVIQLL